MPFVSDQAQQQPDSSATPPSKRVYIGNLPYHAQSADIETYLSEAGFQVERLDISTDPFTGRNPSYCFVELPSAAEAQRAIQELPGASFMGRPLRVNVHIPRRNGAAPSSTRQQSDYSNSSSPRPAAGTNGGWREASRKLAAADGTTTAPSSPAFDRWNRREEAPARWTQPVQQSKRLYVGGLPQVVGQEVLDQAMQELFAEFTVEAVSKLISPHESKQALPGSHFYCFVDLASTEEAESAMKALDGQQTQWGGNLRVSMARDRQDRKVVREQGLASAESPAPSPKPARDFSGSWRRAG